jgi:hypothetical protein
LLENNGKGQFSDITASALRELKNIGMVTDAIWLDYDRDGDKDLILAGEWMNISILKNDGGIFTDATTAARLDVTSGWWNCIYAADVDLDGDMDLVGGNLGLNSVLKASEKEPVEMYLNDFDNNGTIDPVLCSYEDGISYPFASLDELSDQIDGIKKKFPNYSDFGGKTVAEILGKEAIGKSLVKKAVLFESCVFINNGDGTFKTEKLPVQAQFSPIRDLIVKDFDSDGINDIVTIGNDYWASPSIGRYDASYGWFLKGQKDCKFTALTPVNSGLLIKGDGRKIRPLMSKRNQFLISAVNNGKLQTFQLLNQR